MKLLQPIQFNASVDRSAGARLQLSAERDGCKIMFLGSVPLDLTVSLMDATGGVITESFPMALGEKMSIRAAQIVITHAASVAGGTFMLVIAHPGADYDPASRGSVQLFRVGSKVNDVVPARIATGIIVSQVSDVTTVAVTAVNGIAGKRFRLLWYRVDVPGFMIKPAALACTIDIGGTSTGGLVGFGFQAWTAAVLGIPVTTGLVQLGDGILLQAGEGIFSRCAGAGAGSSTYTLYLGYTTEDA